MRAIIKNGEPRELINWKRENQNTPDNLHYGGGGFPREHVRTSLLAEQHFLCAYTMKELPGSGSCHIEHIKPQSKYTPADSIDYGNMVACYPGSDGKIACEYGAVYKKNYDAGALPFVSPLNPFVSSQFRFHRDGRIEGLTDAARATEEVLNLNHPVLKNNRAAAVKGWLQPNRKRVLSAAEARRLAAQVLQPDRNGRLTPYCTAVAQAATEYAKKEENRAARMRVQGRG